MKKKHHRSVAIEVSMKWIEPNQQWFMYNAKNNKFIMNFFDCENITRLFPAMGKDKKDNVYQLKIKKTPAATR